MYKSPHEWCYLDELLTAAITFFRKWGRGRAQNREGQNVIPSFTEGLSPDAAAAAACTHPPGPLGSCLRHRLAPSPRTSPDAVQERDFVIKNQNLFNFKKKEQSTSTRSTADVLCRHLRSCRWDSVSLPLSALHPPGWLAGRGPSDDKMAASPLDLHCYSLVAPMEREGLFSTSSHKSPGIRFNLVSRAHSPKAKSIPIAREYDTLSGQTWLSEASWAEELNSTEAQQPRIWKEVFPQGNLGCYC